MTLCGCSSLEQCQRKVMRVVNASPVILLGVILAWCYWAYLFRLCWGILANGQIVQGCLYILLFQPMYGLCVWSFWKVTRTSPGYSSDIVEYSHGTNSEGAEEIFDTNEDMQLLSHPTNNEVSDETSDEESEGNKHRDTAVAVLHVNASESTLHLPRPMPPQRTAFYKTTPAAITVKRCGETRFCKKCHLKKFDRTHHCRQCQQCVLKMDHHCPWVNNCVGFQNYKFFYLFLVYSSLVCLFVFGTTLPPTLKVLHEPLSIFGLDFHWILLLFVSVVFGIFLVPFTLFHTRQLFKNRTTIEFYEKANFRLGRHRGHYDVMRSQYFNPWDLGSRSNIQQVLGEEWQLWCLPIGKPKGSGCHFQINKYAYDTLDTEERGDGF